MCLQQTLDIMYINTNIIKIIIKLLLKKGKYHQQQSQHFCLYLKRL